MNEVEIAWCAGLYEGEGTLGPSRTAWRSSINSTDKDVIERLHATTGVGVVYFVKRGKPHWQDQWRWCLTRRNDLAEFMTLIRPYLGQRRGARVDEFLAWHETHAPGRELQRYPWAKDGKCRTGRHPKTTSGPCLPCAADRQRRYRARHS